MKNTLIVLLLLIATYANAQSHRLTNPDKVPNCKLIHSGKFVNQETAGQATPGYYMVFKDGFATEYVEDGKYFIKSKVTFEGECKYKSVIMACTIPDFDAKIGEVLNTEILETATSDNLIKIRSRMNIEWQTFVLKKVE